MPFVRAKRKGERTYYYLVESKRNGKKVNQKVLRYLGVSKPTEEELQKILKELNR